MNVYYGAVLGGLGGLLGWAALGSVFQPESAPALLRPLFEGAVVGAFIGALVGSVEGALNGNLRELWTGLSRSLVLSVPGGAIGLGAGELALQLVGGGLLARAVGWAVFGGAVGIAQGQARRSIQRGIFGAVGGLLGGSAGGLLLEFLAQQGAAVQATTRGIGLVILGALIGALVVMVAEAFVRARVRVVNGRREGREYALDKTETSIGASDGCDIYLPGDPAMRPVHALIRSAGKSVEIVATGGGAVWVNGSAMSARASLKDGDQLLLGSTRLRLQLTRAAKA